MQDDLNSILEKTGNGPAIVPTFSDSVDEDIATSEAEGNAPVVPVAAVEGEKKSVPFAEQIRITRERALESEREFKRNVAAMQEQDPALAKKIKLVGIGIAALVLVFAVVLFISTRKPAEETVKTPAAVESNSVTPVLSEYEKLKEAQNVNDKLRVENLTNIAHLAVVYHLEQKADLPISPIYVKLNEVNPVVDFLKDALTKYENSTGVLLDPRNPDYYYAYRSADGRNIELSARLENETGEYCQEGGSPCIFKKVITEAEMVVMSRDLEKYK